MASPLECFEPQSQPLTCVAACVAMVRRWRGEAVTEGDLLLAWGSPPFSLAVQGVLVGTHLWLDPDSTVALELLAQRVRQGWAIVTVIPAPRRCAHAIVIFGVGSDGTLGILDPASPFTAQPVTLSQEAFAAQWTGELLVVADRA